MDKCAAWHIADVTDHQEKLVVKDNLLCLLASNTRRHKAEDGH